MHPRACGHEDSATWWCALIQQDLAAAENAGHTSLKLYRSLRDDVGVAEATELLAMATSDAATSRRLFAEAARIFHERGHVAAITVDVNRSNRANTPFKGTVYPVETGEVVFPMRTIDHERTGTAIYLGN